VEGSDRVIVRTIMPEFPHRNREKMRHNQSGYAVSWLSIRVQNLWSLTIQKWIR